MLDRGRAARRAVLALVVAAGLASCSFGDAEDAGSATTGSVTPTRPPTSAPPVVPDLTDQSCGEIARATAGAQDAFSSSLADITAAPEAFRQVAENLRAAAADAGDEAAAAAEDLAAVFDDYADKIQSGQVLGLDFDALTDSIDRLLTVCG